MLNQGREFWINLRLDEWQAIGSTMKDMREKMNITVRDMAISLGVSIPRLKRFEKGEPVRDAKLLYNSYILKLDGENMHRHYENLYNYMHGVQQYKPTFEMVIENARSQEISSKVG